MKVVEQAIKGGADRSSSQAFKAMTTGPEFLLKGIENTGGGVINGQFSLSDVVGHGCQERMSLSQPWGGSKEWIQPRDCGFLGRIEQQVWSVC